MGKARTSKYSIQKMKLLKQKQPTQQLIEALQLRGEQTNNEAVHPSNITKRTEPSERNKERIILKKEAIRNKSLKKVDAKSCRKSKMKS